VVEAEAKVIILLVLEVLAAVRVVVTMRGADQAHLVKEMQVVVRAT
jgi:hypothetical protein